MFLIKTYEKEINKESIFSFISISILSSFLIALFSKIRFFLPFSPIPVVFQLQIVFLLSFLLKSKKASFSVFLFLIQGAIGWSIFSGFGIFGITAGYLIGYLFAPYVIERSLKILKKRTLVSSFLAISFANFIVYLFGASYLSFFIGIKKAIFLGVVPFIFLDFFKNLLVIRVLKVFKKV